MRFLPSVRLTSLIIFLGCMGLILVGLYMQYQMKLAPCPLCITQRIFIILVGLIGLVAFIHHPKKIGQIIYGLIGAIAAVAGGGFSTRQLYLQNLPEGQAPSCGPDIAYMFENFPLMDALSLLVRGDGNCAEVVWTLFGISIPGWTLVAFTGLVVINLWQAARPCNSSR